MIENMAKDIINKYGFESKQAISFCFMASCVNTPIEDIFGYYHELQSGEKFYNSKYTKYMV